MFSVLFSREEKRREEKRREEKRREEKRRSTQGWRAWSISMMCLYRGGNRAQPCVNLLLTSTEKKKAVPITQVSLSSFYSLRLWAWAVCVWHMRR